MQTKKYCRHIPDGVYDKKESGIILSEDAKYVAYFNDGEDRCITPLHLATQLGVNQSHVWIQSMVGEEFYNTAIFPGSHAYVKRTTELDIPRCEEYKYEKRDVAKGYYPGPVYYFDFENAYGVTAMELEDMNVKPSFDEFINITNDKTGKTYSSHGKEWEYQIAGQNVYLHKLSPKRDRMWLHPRKCMSVDRYEAMPIPLIKQCVKWFVGSLGSTGTLGGSPTETVTIKDGKVISKTKKGLFKPGVVVDARMQYSTLINRMIQRMQMEKMYTIAANAEIMYANTDGGVMRASLDAVTKLKDLFPTLRIAKGKDLYVHSYNHYAIIDDNDTVHYWGLKTKLQASFPALAKMKHWVHQWSGLQPTRSQFANKTRRGVSFQELEPVEDRYENTIESAEYKDAVIKEIGQRNIRVLSVPAVAGAGKTFNAKKKLKIGTGVYAAWRIQDYKKLKEEGIDAYGLTYLDHHSKRGTKEGVKYVPEKKYTVGVIDECQEASWKHLHLMLGLMANGATIYLYGDQWQRLSVRHMEGIAPIDTTMFDANERLLTSRRCSKQWCDFIREELNVEIYGTRNEPIKVLKFSDYLESEERAPILVYTNHDGFVLTKTESQNGDGDDYGLTIDKQKGKDVNDTCILYKPHRNVNYCYTAYTRAKSGCTLVIPDDEWDNWMKRYGHLTRGGAV